MYNEWKECKPIPTEELKLKWREMRKNNIKGV